MFARKISLLYKGFNTLNNIQDIVIINSIDIQSDISYVI